MTRMRTRTMRPQTRRNLITPCMRERRKVVERGERSLGWPSASEGGFPVEECHKVVVKAEATRRRRGLGPFCRCKLRNRSL